MKLPAFKGVLPGWRSSAGVVLSAALLVLAFPDLEIWFLSFIAFVPFFWAVEREKESVVRTFLSGWLFGAAFFMGSCWWLTYAPINYGGFPPLLAYTLIFIACALAGTFCGVFAVMLGVMFRKFGSTAVFAAPFVWVFSELLRFWLGANNWNAAGYALAFTDFVILAKYGGIYIVSFVVLAVNTVFYAVIKGDIVLGNTFRFSVPVRIGAAAAMCLAIAAAAFIPTAETATTVPADGDNVVITVQVNVPMSGLSREKWRELRERHVALSEQAVAQLTPEQRSKPLTIIFPESPMNFMYEDDPEFRSFIRRFAAKHNAQVLFNSAEPDHFSNKYFNSAVLVNTNGDELVQYDKIYLVPFGESMPGPLVDVMPGFIGSFAYGREHDIFPMGNAKFGVMLCYESHFGLLSRRFVRDGADVIVEMTNDGYLGPTPVLRQHLANSVFRAVETNRPLLRTTNVGITAYISPEGDVVDPAPTYAEAVRVWTVSPSDGSRTLYVRFGDWVAWLCAIITLGLLVFGRKREVES